MDSLLKELTKLEKLTAVNGKGASIAQSLDSLLQSLKEARAAFLDGECSEEDLKQLAQLVEAKKKEVDDRQKEVYSVLSRLGKALDKVCTTVYTNKSKTQSYSTEIHDSSAHVFRLVFFHGLGHSAGKNDCLALP